MRRRDITKALALSTGPALLTRQAAAQTCTLPCYPRTDAEVAAGVTPTNYAYVPGDVRRYGADPTGTSDSTTAINNAIAACGAGGAISFIVGQYKTTAPILAENLQGLTIIAPSGINGAGGAVINAAHTGKAILSLVGSNSCTIGPIVLNGNSSTRPKTGLLLGRSSSASAGNHNFQGTSVIGSYSVAGVYNIASESNCWYGCVVLPSAAPYAGLYMAQADGALPVAIGGLSSASMEDNKFFGGTYGSYDPTTGSAGIWIDAGIATGHIHFYGAFLVKNSGDSFIFLRLGQIDGQGTYFPIGFHDCFSEYSGTAPNSGLHLRNATFTDPLPLAGFTAANIRFNSVISYNIICDGTGGHIQFIGANISTPYQASGRHPSILGNLDGASYANLQFESATTVNEATDSTIICGQGNLTLNTNTGGNTIKNGSAKYQLPVLTSAPVVSGAASAVSSGQICYGGTTANSATTGANGAPPAQVTGYIVVNINGTTCKIPFYNN